MTLDRYRHAGAQPLRLDITATVILVCDGVPDMNALSRQFADKDDSLPEAVRGFVQEKLEELRNPADKAL